MIKRHLGKPSTTAEVVVSAILDNAFRCSLAVVRRNLAASNCFAAL